MKSKLTKGLLEGEQQQLRGEFYASKLFREQLVRLLNERIEASVNTMVDSKNYEISSWGELQADKIGEIRAFRELISLLSE